MAVNYRVKRMIIREGKVIAILSNFMDQNYSREDSRFKVGQEISPFNGTRKVYQHIE
jgi:hypothetical protein